MNEDKIYRTSTQYRLWSYTPDSLASIRSTTNALAADGVNAAIQSLDASKAAAEDAHNGTEEKADAQDTDAVRKVDCLTVEEEQKLVGFYCLKTIGLADFCEFPTNVKASAVQYLKRFYLSNSPMTYHPKEMMPSALFLATKTENNYISLKNFAEKLDKFTPERVIAPEFLLTQGLRFTFDVRHPQRGLEGGFMELMALARGQYQSVAGTEMDLGERQESMVKLEPAKGARVVTKTVDDVIVRIQTAHGKAKEVLKTTALLSDAYFLYTPSQIWLAAFFMADQPLARFYIDTKLPASSPIKPKLMTNLQACAEVLQTSVSAKPGPEEMQELKRIDKKLYKCRNPDKVDLISINKAQKRDGEGKDGTGLDEKVIKKRKLERENSVKEQEDVFGPPLVTKRP
ncbi:MAG: hypothetical protein Q9191_001847 [Dirinaria sp. TL-2023a]